MHIKLKKYQKQLETLSIIFYMCPISVCMYQTEQIHRGIYL
jgi:hypothetical protein